MEVLLNCLLTSIRDSFSNFFLFPGLPSCTCGLSLVSILEKLFKTIKAWNECKTWMAEICLRNKYVYFLNFRVWLLRKLSLYIIFQIPLLNLIKMVCDMAMFRL